MNRNLTISAYSTAGEAGSSAGKHWFGNSSALDSFLASNSPEAQDGAADSAGGSTSVNKALGI